MLVRKIPDNLHNISQIIVRTLIVAATVGVAASVPKLEPLIGLVGSICFSTLGIFIPAVVDIVLRWDGEMGSFKWRLYKNIFLIIFSLFALISGTYYSILSFSNSEN